MSSVDAIFIRVVLVFVWCYYLIVVMNSVLLLFRIYYEFCVVISSVDIRIWAVSIAIQTSYQTGLDYDPT